MLRVVIALFAIALATPQAGQKPATPQKPAAAQKPAAVLAALQGTWVFQTVNDEPPPQELSLTFKGNTYHQTYGGKANERGTFKIDTAKKPMTMDLTITEGSDAGKAQPGIFEVSGDILRWQ